MSRSPGWYIRRLQQMSPSEVMGRSVDQARRVVWSRRQVHVGDEPTIPSGLLPGRVFASPLPTSARDAVSTSARESVVRAADALLAGEWSLLGMPRTDIIDPNWFLDPVTGRHAPSNRFAFRIDHRDEELTGNVKYVWELSRHHHLTVLAAAWWLTGREEFALLVDKQLRSWWASNPFLSGIHWTNGIEVGIRLISWTWIRRLLDDWDGVIDLVDNNPAALRQLFWHQEFLAAFPSHGSSANNHLVAEASGRLVAACAFPWFRESAAWRDEAIEALEHALAVNTFPSGVNRELATDYQLLVAELGMVAGAEADAAGHGLSDEAWRLMTRSLDAGAAMLDVAGRAPRQGDGDEGRGLILDDPKDDAWPILLGAGASLFGSLPWWPEHDAQSVGAVALASLGRQHKGLVARPGRAPTEFRDAGMTILRTPAEDGAEIWCRCDGGPHGYLSIAAHAHADALSVELRYDGVDILADPGTYCYHGEPEWRAYFRSTMGHNTVEVDGCNQSVDTGPFMWREHARTEKLPIAGSSPNVLAWGAEHFGYDRLPGAPLHERTVTLDTDSRDLSIVDVLSGEGEHTVRLLFHCGPTVNVRLRSSVAELSWTGRDGELVRADLHLPVNLRWSMHRGESLPPLGWYSPGFGQRVPATTLVGGGDFQSGLELRTLIMFHASRGAQAPDPRLLEGDSANRETEFASRITAEGAE